MPHACLHTPTLNSTAARRWNAPAFTAALAICVSLPLLLQRRMPSGMLGHKGYWDPLIEAAGSEGGMRNHLTVAGPGVPSGAVHDTLLSLADVLPTIADLGDATATKHLPWSGNSFANLLRHGGRPTKPQQERFFFSMVASGDARSCPHAARLMTVTLPNLGRDRCVRMIQCSRWICRPTACSCHACALHCIACTPPLG